MELLAPAGSYEGVVAAVSNGADAVYLGLGNFNARRNAKNLTDDEFLRAVRYCRVRGVRVYVTLNTLLTDRELSDARETICRVYDAGADAVLVQDFGMLSHIKSLAPDIDIHASTQMSIHSLPGVLAAAALGVKRVVLARELSRENISEICKRSPIETEIFVHGALCMCYSGQCYMSAAIGGRSGNRGLCAQPCRLGYGFEGKADGYPLSLKDLSLAEHLSELKDTGVSCLKIEGRMKRPEYSAVVTRIYSAALKNGTNPSRKDIELLERVFSRGGFTSAYYDGAPSADMFGVRGDSSDAEVSKLFSQVRAEYNSGREIKRADISFNAEIRLNAPSRLMVRDSKGNSASVLGEAAQPSVNKPLLPAVVNTQLYKTGGTPYNCIDAKSTVPPGAALPISAINSMRREALDALTAEREKTAARKRGAAPKISGEEVSFIRPEIIIHALKLKQLTEAVLARPAQYIYLPVTEICGNPDRIKMLSARKKLAAVFPRVITDSDEGTFLDMLGQVRELGIDEAVVGNIGHILYAHESGFRMRGDFGLNIFNSYSVGEVRDMGFASLTLSPELNLSQIRDITKYIPCEIIAFGRLPLMVTENCIIKNHYGRCVCEKEILLTDRKGMDFPVLREFQHRNVIYNSQKLFLADKQKDLQGLNLWGLRLMLTTESPIEAGSVVDSYCGHGQYTPNVLTRGLYYRGVQ